MGNYHSPALPASPIGPIQEEETVEVEGEDKRATPPRRRRAVTAPPSVGLFHWGPAQVQVQVPDPVPVPSPPVNLVENSYLGLDFRSPPRTPAGKLLKPVNLSPNYPKKVRIILTFLSPPPPLSLASLSPFFPSPLPLHLSISSSPKHQKRKNN
ncbi:hypothetical protein BGZ63DRAFT_156762 [Mariannaea sp. PMI_226]|nr:hypothetical protein BGZ63DRAFT_156762 [Mariannaea sp. PMI_226]